MIDKKMLSRLTIRNYALIDDLELELGDGLTIITGQTGAGKSIILGALSLLLGERADSRAVTDKERKTVVEATFGDDIIVRREIHPSGRSRAFIDDSPVSLRQLSDFTSRLLDIHGQNANQTLSSPEGQMAMIDAFGDCAPLLEEYRRLFREFLATRRRLRELREANEKNRAERDLMAFQLERLDKLKPRPGEMAEVERRYEMLSETEELREALQKAVAALQAEEGAVDSMRMASQQLDAIKMQLVDPDYDSEESLQARLRRALIEVKDISESLQYILTEIEDDPEGLERSAARVNALYEAVRHFKVKDADALVGLRDDLRRRLDSLDSEGEDTVRLEEEGRRIASELKLAGERLTEARRRSSEKFARLVEEKAAPLGLRNLRFEVALSPAKLGADGGDSLQFLCSLNKNGAMLPMSDTASGGERSRLMLAIKGIMADKMQLPTVIFDEIDTGVSGEIADKMGRMMSAMSERTQIIAITHLPQVAACGSTHFKVYKRDGEDKTVTSIERLDRERRIEEIASMMSGEEITPQARSAAKALLAQNND